MGKDFGVSRVLEPKGVVPVTAWRLDNSPEIADNEALVRLEKINVEWDSFQQICSSCGFNENRIRAKVLDIIEKRGKLHNPFTGTGGCFLGTVEKIGPGYGNPDLREGDRIYCLTSLCGVPIKINEIRKIDFNYGQLDVDGYGVIFQASPVCRADDGFRETYAMSALNEAGCLFTAKNIAEQRSASNIVIIGRNACTSVIYASAVRQASPSVTRRRRPLRRFSAPMTCRNGRRGRSRWSSGSPLFGSWRPSCPPDVARAPPTRRRTRPLSA